MQVSCQPWRTEQSSELRGASFGRHEPDDARKDAVITDLTHEVHARSAVELTSSPVQTSTPDDGSGSRFGIGDHVDKADMTQSACPPAAHAQANASRPAPASTSRIGAKRAKTRRSHVV